MTQHKDDCNMAFGRKDVSCPRCQELLNGAQPRQGWQGSYFARKKKEEENYDKRLKNHNCKKDNCGPICTAFDW